MKTFPKENSIMARSAMMIAASVIMMLCSVQLSLAGEYKDSKKQSTHKVDTLEVCLTRNILLALDSGIALVDVSSPSDLQVKEMGLGMLSIRAKEEFDKPRSIMVFQNNGSIRYFVVRYSPSPRNVVMDFRGGSSTTLSKPVSPSAEISRKETVLSLPKPGRQRIFHIGQKYGGITFICENITPMGNSCILTLSLENRSTLSYNAYPLSIVIESDPQGIRSRRRVTTEMEVIPTKTEGDLSCVGMSKSTCQVALDRLALAKGTSLKVYLYEKDFARNMSLKITAKDLQRLWKEGIQRR